MKLIATQFTTVNDLITALQQLPADTEISPFGDEDAALVYDAEGKRAYLDNIKFFEENDMIPEQE
jgi:hypothetical protein